MNEEKLKRFYDNSIEYFDLPDFNTFKSDMQDDASLARLRENMLPYYDLPALEVMKKDFFSGDSTSKPEKSKTIETVEVTEEEPISGDITGLNKDQLLEKMLAGKVDIFTEDNVKKMFDFQEDQPDASYFNPDKPLRQRAPGLYNYYKKTGKIDLDLMPGDLRALSPNLKPLLGKEAKYAPEEEEKQKLIINSKALDNLEKKYTESTTLSDKEKELKLNWIKNKRDEITKQLSFPEKPGFFESTGNSLARGFNSFGKGVVNFAEMGIINAQEQALSIHEMLRGEDVDPEAKKAWLKNIKSELDSDLGMPVVDILNDVYTSGIEQFDEETITDEIGAGNIGNATKRIIYGVAESAPSLLLASTGIGGVVALGASSAGNAFDENFEESIDNGTSLEMLTFSSIGSGAIEAGFEMVTRGVMGRANLLVGEGKKKAAKELVDGYAKNLLKTYAVEGSREGLSEAATELSNDIWKSVTLGEEFDISKNWKKYVDVGLIGVGSGVGVVTTGKLKHSNQAVQEAARFKLMPDSDKQIISEAAENINDLSSQLKQIDESDLSDAEKAGQATTIIEEMKNQANEVTKIKARFKQDLNLMNPDELIEYGKNADKISKAKEGLNSPSVFYKNKSEQEINEATADNENFLREAANRRLTEQTKTVSKEAEKIGKTANTFNTSKEYQEAYDNTEIGKQNSMNVTNSDGFFDPNGNIYINKEVAQKVKAVNVAAHELLHGILRNSFNEPGSLNKVVNEFKSVLPVDVLEKIDQRIDANYRFETFESENDISNEKRKEIKTLKKNEDGTITAELKEEAYNEEYITAFADLIGTRQVKFNENVFQKIGNFFTPIFKGKGYSRIEFNTGKDVYDFVKNYQQQIEKGELKQDILDIAEKGVTGKLITDTKTETKPKKKDNKAQKQIKDIKANIAATGKKSRGMFSFNIQDETPAKKKERQDTRNKRSREIFEKLALDEKGNPLSNKQWRDNITGSKEMGELVMMNLPDVRAIAIEAGNTNPDEVVSATIEPLMKDILAMKPNLQMEATHPIAGYIGQKLGWKTGTGAKSLQQDTPTISMEQEGVRQVAEKQAVEDTGPKETEPVRKGIKLAERLGPKAKKAVDKIKSKITTKALTGAKEIGPITKAEQIEYLQQQTYKSLKDLVSADTQRMFGIVPKPGNLTKADVKNAQIFINQNPDLFYALLPEQHTTKTVNVGTAKNPKYEVRPDKATGVQDVLLNAFYNKGTRKDNLTPWTKKPASAVKTAEFLELYGITERGNPNLYKKDSNVSSRIKALVEQTGRLITNQTVRQAIPEATKVAEGKSKVMFSKQKPNQTQQRKIDAEIKLFDADPGTQVLAENKSFDDILKQYLIKSIDVKEGNQKGKDEVKARIFEGVKEINEDGEEVVVVAPFMTLIPESVLTPGTLSNGGLNKNLSETEGDLDLEVIKKMKASGLFEKVNIKTPVREYTLIDGSKIRNDNPDFISKEVQLKIAPVGKFLFANKLQIDNAIAEAKAKGYEFAPENSKIAMAVKRQGYTARLLKEMKEPGFFEKQMEKRDGLKELMLTFDEAVQLNMKEYLPVVAAILSATSGSQNHLGRTGSIVEFYNTLGLKNVEEHTEPASDLMKFFVNRMAQGNLNEYIDPALDSFFQGALPEVYDGMLKGTGKDGEKFNYIKNVPAEYIADVLLGLKPVWIRYFNPNVNLQVRIDENGKEHVGIDPNVIILSNGKSIAENYGLKLDSKDINPETIAAQQQLLFEIFNGDITQKVAQQRLKDVLPVKILQSKSATPANVDMLNSTGVTKASKNLNNEATVREAGILDKALDVARDPNAPIKKIRVFDFDDTLATTKSNVLYTMPDGKTGKLTPAQYAAKGTQMLDQGAKFDFSEFNKVMDGKKGPLFEVAEAIAGKRGTSDMFVLTARSADAAPAIKEFLDALGLNIPIENITGLGDSSPLAKSAWVVGKAAEGYNDFYFADDHVENVEAVKEGMSKLDVKSKTQLAKQNNLPAVKFSKSLDWKTDEAGNINSKFKIKDKNYNASLVPTDNTGQDYYYEFELETPTGSTQAITGTGDAVAVFRTIYNGLRDAIKQNSNIRQVEFSARKGEPSRVKLYTSLMNKLSKDLGWETDIWETTSILDEDGGHFDFEIVKPRQKQSTPVQKVLDVVDIKSETQQSKIKFSKNVDQIFNDIIENKTGILSEKEYSAAKAKTVGAKKGRWKFWIAPSAEDFVGLLYPLLGKGKLGDTQMAWFKEHLLDPYGRAMENLSRRQNRLTNDFKALKKALVKGGSIPKNLNKKAFDKWTYQDLARVTAWHTQGFDIPGLSKTDLNEMLDFVQKNQGIKTFADQLIMINKGDGYAKPGKDWLAGTISTDLMDGLRTDGRSEYLQEWKANKDLIFSEKNLNKLEAAYGPKYREALEDMLRRMETGKNRTSTGSRLENRLLDYINNSVGTVMFFNMRSGVLQTLSAVNFLNWSDNNILKAGAAFANQPRYWKDFMKLMNSDFLVDRRNGLKINVSESEIADAARTSKNKAKAVISYLLQKGFTVTQIMDSFAIASGGATFYRNRIKKYVKQGMTQADAEAKAYLDFREVAEESQQSARPDRISQQQASALGRVILAFANTPMQYNRIMKKAFLDLKNGRGDAKTHISKMIYYGAIQNMMFVALQQAMFAMAFDDEEEPDEVKRKKYMKMGNSMMDNILRGLGIWGTAASTLIAITRKAIEESQKEGYPGADYDAAAMELLNFSPPIDIKISKLRQAGSNWKYEGWKHDEAAWSMKDPAYKSAAYIISSLTNIPVDRFYKKMDNIQSALDSNNETWKRVANILGWASWELESDADRKERIADEKVRKKDVKDKKKEEATIEEAKAKEATMTPAEKKAAARQKKFDSYKALNKSEQVKMLLELGLTKAEIRALKYEKDRVDKLIELEE